MTFNRLKYKRTADVDTLVYHGVPDLSIEALQESEKLQEAKWTYIELIDYSGDSQSMRRGDKLNMFKLFSLVYHHNAYLNYDVWRFVHNRPLIFLNISINCFYHLSSLINKQVIISFLIRTTIHRNKSTTTTQWITF